jgi:hypothetical protein
MKTSFPLNSTSAPSVICHIGNHPPCAAPKKTARLTDAIKPYLLVMRAVSPAILMVFACATPARAAESETEGKTIAFVPGVMGNAFYVTMERGIRSEASKYGFKIDIQTPSALE